MAEQLNTNKDGFYSSDEFQAFFNQSSHAALIKANAPRFTIIAVSDTYLQMTQRKREEMLNQDFFAVFPGNAVIAAQTDSLLQSFERVAENKTTDVLPVYDSRVFIAGTGEYLTQYWSNNNEPVIDGDGNVSHIIRTIVNVTDKVLGVRAEKETGRVHSLLEREQALNEEMAATNEELKAVNEELHASQEKLNKLNDELEKRVESRTREMKNSESRFRLLVEQIPVAINVFATQDLIVELPNDRMLEIWGRTFAEVAGKPLATGMPELEGQPFMQKLRDVIFTGVPYASREERAFIQRSGKLEECYFNIVYQPVVNEDGTITSCLQIAGEVTEEVVSRQRIQMLNEELAAINEELRVSNEDLIQAQQDLFASNTGLSESRRQLLSVFEQAPLAFCILQGADLVIELANDRMLRLWNTTAEAVLGKPHHGTREAPETAAYLKILDNVYATGTAYHAHEVKAYMAAGNEKEWGYFSFTYQPIKDENGNTTGILAVVDDVTEMTEVRKEKERIDNQLNIAINAARLGSWYIHPQTKTLSYNRELAVIFGYEGTENMTYDEAIGQVTEEYREKIVEEIEKAIADGGDYEIVYQQRRFNDGKLIWLRSLGKISQDEEGAYTIFAGVVIDITGQIQATDDIQKLNEELTATNEELLQVQNDYIRAAEQSEKYSADLLFTIDAAGLATFDFNPVTGTFSGNDLLKSWFGLEPEEEIELQKATDVIAEADRERVVKAIGEALLFSSGGHYDTEYAIINPDNPVARIVKAKGKTLFNEEQMPVRLSGTLQDITEQKKDEQRKNDFIGMVSHEMKTPLTSLHGYVQLLQMNTKSEDAVAINMLGKANKQINRITTLINGFLNVSRLESGKIHIDKQRFDMANLIREAEEEVVSTITSHKVIFAPVETIFVNADRDKINQVISNLIANAVKYSPASTIIRVACVNLNECAMVSVKDEGIGIKEEDQPKLFDRYYRVNNDNATSASGFGIGLYLCAEIIQRHDGKIWVESVVGKGSTFYFNLPVEKK